MGETEFEEVESLGAVARSHKKNLRSSKVTIQPSSATPSPSAKVSRASVKNMKEEPLEDDDDNDLIASKNRRISGSIKQAKKETLYDSARSSSGSANADKVKEPSKKKSVEKVTKKVKVEGKTESPAKKTKKVYELPGQKRDSPEERDPLRIFYESLYNQIPTSEMAQIWMLESGLLEKDVAQKVFERKQKQKRQSLPGFKKVVPVSKTNPSSNGKKNTNGGDRKQAKKRKKVDNEEDSDGEIIAKRSAKN